MAPATRAVQQTPGNAERRAAAWQLSGESVAPYLFALPALGLVGVFVYWPVLYSAYLSTLRWNFVSPERAFVGAGNFSALAADGGFRQAVGNTGAYLLVLVPLLVALPLALALLLWPVRRSRLQAAYRAALFAPTVVSFAVAAVVWLWIFNPVQGVLNQAILRFGGERVGWLGDPSLAFWCVVAVSAWKAIGFNLLLYLAALEAVPRDYLEAAALDGAGWWSLLRDVRLPLIAPTGFFVLVTTTIFVADDVFAAVNVLTNGGPFGRTTNVLYFLYERGFRFFQVGQASAVALVIFCAVVALTWLQFRILEKRVHYG